MNDIIEKVEKYKKQIKDAEIEKAKYEGKKEEVLNSLKEEFGIETLEQAEERLKILKKDKEFIGKEIAEKLESLEENFDWD